ncbi:glycosyltransferase [Vibrio diazotrophicus]|uniref:glycosyltransferase n=1 Tax=Vibrio diazotrophicus TaxID=685 RepID=UPI000C9DF81F|nr:glycosyltransferase [Vibrio diazotrophicus]PNH90082.1 RfaG [Vibrio diazotrophicus]
MKFNHFIGRVIQVIESVDKFDACSEQVVNIDKYFQNNYGLNCYICSKHIHPEVHLKNYINIENLEVNENDIIIFHFSAFSEWCASRVIASEAVKVILYHNITPHNFFLKGSELYNLCKKGREQLKDILSVFDYAVGDSEYNLKELRELGFPESKMFLLPIVIDQNKFLSDSSHNIVDRKNHIISLGRICENKCQVELIKAFSESNYNGILYLVGGYNKTSEYGIKVANAIRDLDLSDRVILTGKISQEELNKLLAQSDALISRSEHEGFCVPLIEASVMGVPVIALAKAAVGEVLGDSPGLYHDDNGLHSFFDKLPLSDEIHDEIVTHQYSNLRRYTEQSWLNHADCFLNAVIGSSKRFNNVSIVICTYNRADYLERALDYLTRQYSSNFEVIVVNGPSTDNTADVLEKWKERIKVATNPKANLSISRNMGIELSSGDLIAFIDDDAIPFYDWVTQLISGFNARHQLTAGLGGPTYFSGTLDFQAIDISVDHFGDGIVNPPLSIQNSPNYKRSLLGTNSAFRADYLREIGGFDEEYDYYLDESDVCFRLNKAGYKNCHHNSLYLRHEFAQSSNRINKYKYNYYSIVKNTAYFALNFADGSDDEILDQVKSRIQRSRVDYIKLGVSEGVLSSQEGVGLVNDVWRGFSDGKKHFQMPKRLLNCRSAHPLFKKFNKCSHDLIQKHIVIVSSEFPPFTKAGGVGTLYYNLASELLIMGHKVTVISKGSCDDVVNKGNFTIHFLEDKRSFQFKSGSTIIDTNLDWSMKVANRVAEINESDKVDIVDSCVWDCETFALSRLKEKLAIKLVTRLVTPFAVANQSNGWGIDGLELSSIMELELMLVTSSDAVIPISESILNTFKSTYELPEIDTIKKVEAGIAYWPTYDVSQGYNDLKGINGIDALSESFKVLFLGRLEKRKGIDVLLRSAGLYKSKYPNDDISFVVAGKDLIGVENFIKENKLEHIGSSLRLLGEVDLWSRDKLYSFADSIVFPSRYESFGLVPLEAFVHGKPVIASNAGAIPEVVQDGISGLLFDDGNVEQLCDRIKSLYDDRALISKLSAGAFARIRELSSVEMAKKTEKLYQKLLEI